MSDMEWLADLWRWAGIHPGALSFVALVSALFGFIVAAIFATSPRDPDEDYPGDTIRDVPDPDPIDAGC